MIKKLAKVFAMLLIMAICLSCSKKVTLVGLQPFGDLDKSQIVTIATAIERTYNVKVVVLPKKKLPKQAFVNIKTPRYRADSLIIYLQKHKPDTIDYIMGLTSLDISVTKRDTKGQIMSPEYKYRDWGVLGLGLRPGPSCIVSTLRMRTKNSKLFVERLGKVCIHELGHNFGLKHCTTSRCVMSDALESIKTIDNEREELCSKCRNTMQIRGDS